MNSAYVNDYDNAEGASCSNEPTCTQSDQSTRSALDRPTCSTPDQPINAEDIEMEINTASKTSAADSCTNLMLHPEGSNTALILEHENSIKRHIGVENDYSDESEWETTKFFR